ncbi:MAG TPA: L-histidine N(alpha)-methyltransferase [Acetobacteraceae bacterium]|nr:L-histidine N(alpha)-methyltransferase [Acetobacteraceae bacterium]
MADLALAGLRRPQKSLPPQLFYDEEGCRLFYRITELPEYYLTRTERALLADIAPDVLRRVPSAGVLVEYGASDEAKALHLLQSAGQTSLRAYVPVDVAAAALEAMRTRLGRQLPWLSVHPVARDFMQPITLPPAVAGLARLGFFPGSTIGNLDPEASVAFLRSARRTLGPRAQFLVGADLRKHPDVLLPAYDDKAGITAAFNRNLLVRLNREAAADFDLNRFAHRTVWNDAASRIEMHLVSSCDQVVLVAGQPIHFTAGETIHTENSYKHTPEAFLEITGAAGWGCREIWTDPKQWFALYLLEPRAAA